MNRYELARKTADHWATVLGAPLQGKPIHVSFAAEGRFPDSGTIVHAQIPFRTRDTSPKAVAHLLRDGRPIPKKEFRDAVREGAFDAIEITVFQVPERGNVPNWVAEEYFTRGILRALLKVKYPDWNERQLTSFEEKYLGKKTRGRISFPRVVFYTCVFVPVAFLVNFVVFWVLNGFTADGIRLSLCIAIMVEGLVLMIVSLTLAETFDTTVYSPSGRIFYEHVRFPPKPTVALASFASGLALFVIGLVLFS